MTITPIYEGSTCERSDQRGHGSVHQGGGSEVSHGKYFRTLHVLLPKHPC